MIFLSKNTLIFSVCFLSLQLSIPNTTTIRPVRPRQRLSHFKRSRKNVKWRNGSTISPFRHFRHSTISLFRHSDFLLFRPHVLRHLRIISITQSISELVIAVPLGRHNPRSNKSSATFPPTTLAEYLCFPCGPLISDLRSRTPAEGASVSIPVLSPPARHSADTLHKSAHNRSTAHTNPSAPPPLATFQPSRTAPTPPPAVPGPCSKFPCHSR